MLNDVVMKRAKSLPLRGSEICVVTRPLNLSPEVVCSIVVLGVSDYEVESSRIRP
jgi:hypothetical protein